MSQVGQLAGFPEHFSDSTEEKDTGQKVSEELKNLLNEYWKL